MPPHDKARDFVIYGYPDDEKVQQLQQHLQDRGMPFDFVNIDEDNDAMQFVVLQNDGGKVSPTVVIGPDQFKKVLTQPTPEQVDEALDQLGYRDPRQNLDGRDGNPQRF